MTEFDFSLLEKGFSIAVAVFLLVKFDRSINSLTDAVQKMERSIELWLTKEA